MPKTTKASKTPRKIGRPSSFTDEIAAKICERLAEGKSLRTICKDDVMPGMSTVMNWLANGEHKSFVEQYARARDIQADRLFEEILEIADDASGDWITLQDGKRVVNHEHVQRAKLRVDAKKWAAGRLAPKKYGDRTFIDTPAHNEPGKPSEQDSVWATELEKAMANPDEAGKVVPLKRPGR